MLKPLRGYTLHIFYREGGLVQTYNYELRAPNGIRIEHRSLSGIIDHCINADIMEKLFTVLGAQVIWVPGSAKLFGVRPVWKFDEEPLRGYHLEVEQHLYSYESDEFGPSGYEAYQFRFLDPDGREVPLELPTGEELGKDTARLLVNLLTFLGAKPSLTREYH